MDASSLKTLKTEVGVLQWYKLPKVELPLLAFYGHGENLKYWNNVWKMYGIKTFSPYTAAF